MEQKELYTVNGCEWFIPVKLIEIEEDKYTKRLEVEAIESGCRAFVPSIYKFKKAEEPQKVHEPQKVAVPKFVVDWIEDNKGYISKWDEEGRADFVFMAIDDLFRLGEGLKPLDFIIDEKVSEWMTENTYKFITAILFDCIVEKEKLYTVEIPNPNLNAHVVLQKTGDGIVLVTVGNAEWAEWAEWESSKLTEAEIKKDFEWAWQFAKEVK